MISDFFFFFPFSKDLWRHKKNKVPCTIFVDYMTARDRYTKENTQKYHTDISVWFGFQN